MKQQPAPEIPLYKRILFVLSVIFLVLLISYLQGRPRGSVAKRNNNKIALVASYSRGPSKKSAPDNLEEMPDEMPEEELKEKKRIQSLLAHEFPIHWGPPHPSYLQPSRSSQELPGGYGVGSKSLSKWIQQKMDEDAGADPTYLEYLEQREKERKQAKAEKLTT